MAAHVKQQVQVSYYCPNCDATVPIKMVLQENGKFKKLCKICETSAQAQ